VAALAQGVPVEVIWIYDIIGENEALVVPEDAPIDSVEDLVGKTVAAPFGATTHYHLLVALRLAGVSPEDVTILDMAPSEMRAAWQRGDIDAGFVWEPTLSAMLALDGRVLVSSKELAEAGFLTGDIGIVRREFAQSHPEIVARYLVNQVRAVQFIRDNPQQAAAAVARQFDLAEGEALRQMESLVFLSGEEQLSDAYLGPPESPGEIVDVFVETAQFLVNQGTLPALPERTMFERAVNTRYLQEALEMAR
jgi:taurine transport system substrate-binding protein